MRKLIRTLALLALLGSRAAVAQIIGNARASAGPARPAVSSLMRDTRLIGSAPIGHRQPRASDVPSEKPSELEQLSADDAAVDR